MAEVERKRCPYCLHLHGNPGRACSTWCERKIAARSGWITRSRHTAIDKLFARAQKRVRHVPKWRQISMGDDPADHLPAIFGTAPATTTPRHGDTLDA